MKPYVVVIRWFRINSALISELDGEFPEIVGDSLDYIEDRLPQTRWYIELFRIFCGVAELCLKCYFAFRKKLVPRRNDLLLCSI